METQLKLCHGNEQEPDLRVNKLRALSGRKPVVLRPLSPRTASLAPPFTHTTSSTMQAVCSFAAAPVACANVKAAQAPVQVKAVAPRMAVAPKSAVSNVVSARQMLVWEPKDNK